MPEELTPIDIFLPAHGRLDLTMRSVGALYANTTVPFHLIVLDDSDASIEQGAFHPVDPIDVTSEFFKKLCKKYPNVTYINAPRPYKCGNEFFNEGLKHCKYDYVATVMNSLIVEKGWETVGIQLMNQDPKIGTIGFKNLLPDGSIEHAGIVFQGHIPTDYGKGAPNFYCNEVREAIAVQWAFALHRKDAILGNLDENLFHGFVGWDDIDNCFVVRSKGWKVLYCGQGIGTHFPRATRGDDSIEACVKNKENGEKFYKRWGYWKMFMEAHKMDVTYRLSPKIKEQLTNGILEHQVLEHLAKDSYAKLQELCKEVMNELSVDSEKYVLDANPRLNLWEIRAKDDPKSNGSDEDKKVEIAKAIELRQAEIAEAMKKMEESKVKIEKEFREAEDNANKRFEADTSKVLVKEK